MLEKNKNIVSYLFISLYHEESKEDIIRRLQDIPQVTEINRVYGTYDIILRIETETSSDIKSVTLKSIRSLNLVQKTMTMISLETWDRK